MKRFGIMNEEATIYFILQLEKECFYLKQYKKRLRIMKNEATEEKNKTRKIYKKNS